MQTDIGSDPHAKVVIALYAHGRFRTVNAPQGAEIPTGAAIFKWYVVAFIFDDELVSVLVVLRIEHLISKLVPKLCLDLV